MTIYSRAKTFKKHTSFDPGVTQKYRCKSVFLSKDVPCSIIFAGKNYKEANILNQEVVNYDDISNTEYYEAIKSDVAEEYLTTRDKF